MDNPTTVSYLKRKWGYESGSSSNIEFVVDPEQYGDGTALKVSYPKGSWGGSKISGGVGGMHLAVLGLEEGKKQVQRAILSYEVAFSAGFDFVKGGKLPGLFGGDRKGGCSGGKHSTDCFSLRLMWRPKGDAEVYAYIPTYPFFCALDPLVFCESTYGTSIGRSSFNLTTNSSPPSPGSIYTRVTQLVILNSSPTTANGVLEMYKDGVLAFRDDKLLFRTNMEVGLGDLFFSTFFGGGDKSWASQGGEAYFRGFEFFVGQPASDLEGESVQAT